MDLEKILAKAAKKSDDMLESAPWYAKWLFAPEYNKFKQSLGDAAAKMKGYAKRKADPRWYLEMSKLAGNAYQAIDSAVDKVYDVIDAVRACEDIPIIGPWLSSARDDYMKKLSLKSIPDKRYAKYAAAATYDAVVAGLCMAAESSTDYSFSQYRAAIKKQDDARPQHSSPIRYFTDAIKSVKEFFSAWTSPNVYAA